MRKKVNIFWFRRDLRLHDNVGLHKALQGKFPLLPIFIFDTEILHELPKDDARVSFISENLQKMRDELLKVGSSLAIYHGTVGEVWSEIVSEYDIQNVITNRDYEPYALQRDSQIERFLSSNEIGFYTYKDQVIFETNEIVKSDGTPYVVYTPYMKVWKKTFNQTSDIKEYDSSPFYDNLIQTQTLPYHTLEDIGCRQSKIKVQDYNLNQQLIDEYEARRNFPAQDATSHLGPHLRFGTLSVRMAVKRAIASKNEVFWQELIWREFFMQILWHFPKTVDHAFRSKYDLIRWRNNEEEFDAWKSGQTGYPLVDAGMRELNKTGHMHNRVRMLVASFLCKHLLIDWRWGEAYFAKKLLDFELSSNVGNWQWAAGTGVDAAPYFRIFNPTTQIDKFDKQHEYIEKWVPDRNDLSYPQPIVDHKFARERCLSIYKTAIN